MTLGSPESDLGTIIGNPFIVLRFVGSFELLGSWEYFLDRQRLKSQNGNFDNVMYQSYWGDKQISVVTWISKGHKQTRDE